MFKKILEVPFEDLADNEILALLTETDKFMVRVSEDAIRALLKKSLITPRDLPDSAREVLDARNKLRQILEERQIKLLQNS